MKCPHCDYFHGWDGDILDIVEGSEGDFYRLSVKMERASKYSFDNETVKLYACPKCNKTFIGGDL